MITPVRVALLLAVVALLQTVREIFIFLIKVPCFMLVLCLLIPLLLRGCVLINVYMYPVDTV